MGRTSELKYQQSEEGATGDDKSLQRRLHRSECAARDLKSGLDSERANGLRERKYSKLLEAELEALRREVGRREEERGEAVRAADEARRQQRGLRAAMRCEAENFRKLQSALADERARTRAAADSDSDTIIELRTALEVEREQKLALERERASGGGKNKKQDLDVVIVEVSKENVIMCTGCLCQHRKWRETKLQPSSWPGLALLGCSFVSLHFQC